jgi:hypothetical protein
LLPWKSNKYCIFWVCVYSLSYPAYKAYVLYYIVISGLRGSTKFCTLSHERHDFLRKGIVHNICIFYLQLMSETFFIVRIILRDIIIKCTFVFTYSTCYSCQISMKLDFPWQVFEKSSKFHADPSSARRIVPCGQMDRQTAMTKLRDTLCNFANMPEIKPW